MLNTVIIQPPLVQLNTPYPSGAYLKAFFKKVYEQKNIEGSVEWFDLSTELFHSIFCKKGLEHIFHTSSGRALNLADNFENQGDEDSAFQLRRYVSQSELWVRWIDVIVSVVCGGDSKISGREFTHEFVRSAHSPRGNRMERFLSELGRDVGVDDSQILASLALADLADYITMCYDSNFALIRYAEHLATSTSRFEDVLNGLNSPVLKNFYAPLLQKTLEQFSKENTLYCVSVPFPGCFEAAVFTGQFIKHNCTLQSTVAFGGGYINTELRTVQEKRLFDYCDFLSYDKGYGSYLELFYKAGEINFDLKKALNGKPFYNLKYISDNKIVEPLTDCPDYQKAEKQFIRTIVPDFSGIDFSRFPRLADDNNAMHRIWNDGAWLKAYMAYGCYWHRCAFCDTSLDYVKGFCGTDVSSLYKGLHEQAERAGVYGIHFVDEACPPISMQKFALLNAECEKVPLTWWGNIRFEKTFSRDLADLLSYGGLTAVSGGIEIATGSGLDSVNKGTDIESIVAACCAFKEAGVLVHSYMIFGFWNQSDQDLINSMETLRQMFANGILDSAFWHQFTLTQHSTVYKEWLEGKHPELKPIAKPEGQFAENDIHYQGEGKSEKYSAPLNTALELWMHGQKLNKNVESYFPFKMPSPSIPKNYVEQLIAKYEKKRDLAFNKIPQGEERFVWLGGKVFVLKAANGVQLCWSYMGELLYADADKKNAQQIADLFNNSRDKDFSKGLMGTTIVKVSGTKLFKDLRGKGLCALI